MRKSSQEHAAQTQAADYVTRLYSGEMSAQEEQAIAAWRRQSPVHEREFQHVLSLWELSNSLYQPSTTAGPDRHKHLKLALSAVASVAFVLIAGAYVWKADLPLWEAEPPGKSSPLFAHEIAPPGSRPDAGESAPTIASRLSEIGLNERLNETRYLHTAAGEVDTVGLADGSSVTLNSATTIQISFNEQERHVAMLGGEAFFDVASEPDRPFVIDTGTQIIRVLGTKFNVQKANGDVRVAVLEGTVAVSRSSSTEPEQHHKSTEGYLLEAGSMGSFSALAEVIVPDNHAQVLKAQGWREGIFRFSDEPLSAVIQEFNRYRTKKIRIKDAAADLRISGIFHFGEGEGLVEALQATLPITITEANGAHEVWLAETN